MHCFRQLCFLAAILSALKIASVHAAPAVTVSTLKGEQHEGELQQITNEAISLKVKDESVQVPLEEVLNVVFGGEEPKPGEAATVEIVLTDGSRLKASTFTSAKNQFSAVTESLGTLMLPAKSVKSVRLAAPAAALEEGWSALLGREIKEDMVVVARKTDVLDHISGIIGDMDDKTIQFLLDGNEVPVKKDRVFGLIFANPTLVGKPQCQITLANAQSFKAASVEWTGEKLKVKNLFGTTQEIAPEQLRQLDFSGVKIQYLSALQPRRVEYTQDEMKLDGQTLPFIANHKKFVMEMRVDEIAKDRPLRIGNQIFKRGLWLHSKTDLQYNIAGDYRRFNCIAGMEYAASNARKGDVTLIIKGDGKTLFSEPVTGNDKQPYNIDLDIAGVQVLEITVDFTGKEPNTLEYVFVRSVFDHLVLGDAKLTK